MAIGTPSQSPAVVIKEVDLSGVVPNVQSTMGAIVGNYRWGPVDTRERISNESQLAATFGNPDDTHSIDFHSAAYYMRYSSDLMVTRVVDSAYNAVDADVYAAADSNNAILQIKNRDDFDNQMSTLATNGHTFIAKYPGSIGNSLKVSMCPADSAAFSNWAYKSNFDAHPGTSAFASSLNAQNDEFHVAVIDTLGSFGAKGSVLETFPFVSGGTNAKRSDGSTNYGPNVINNGSNYVWMAGFDSDFTASGNGTTLDSADNLASLNSATDYILARGTSDSASGGITVGAIQTGFDLYSDADNVEVDFLIAPSMGNRTDQTAVVNNLAAIAIARKDCVAVASPAREDVLGIANAATITTNIETTADDFTATSYLVADANFLKVYDKYNDKYIHIPAASSTAGIMSASDANAAPWVSPAGARRGAYLGVTNLAYSPSKAQRDTLYKASVNPVANIPGQGVLLFGDKTHMNRPSAFDRINVRRLFLVVERAIAEAAKNVMFELNDEFTRAEFVNIVEPFLREIKGRRGITDFKVVCNETNNTSAVIDRNEFVANIFIKPARSINFITLNFVAVRSGVEFEEVVGTV